jgi:hypothetical protein
MAIYSLSLNSTVTTTGAAAWDIKAASTNRPAVMEISLNLGAATASTYGLGRSGNTPTQTSPVLVQAEDPGDPAGISGCAVAWSVAPTVPTQFHRRVALPATIGSGIIWTFPRGLILATSASLLVWNLATNSASVNVHVVCDE